MTLAMYNAQTNLISALRLFFIGEETRLAVEQPAMSATCQKFAALLVELGAIDNAAELYTYKELYEYRDAALKGIAESYAALSNCLTQDRLQRLQFNGIEIDTELVRLFFYGQNLVAMPNP